MRHKNTSLQPVPLASGRVLEPGETVNDHDLDHDGNEVAGSDRVQIDAGNLTPIPDPKPAAKSKAKAANEKEHQD